MSVAAPPGANEYGGAPLMTLRWALKRALIGIAILFAFVTSAALLFEAAVESDTTAAQAAVAAETVVH